VQAQGAIHKDLKPGGPSARAGALRSAHQRARGSAATRGPGGGVSAGGADSPLAPHTRIRKETRAGDKEENTVQLDLQDQKSLVL
jgi:hypothetical protein